MATANRIELIDSVANHLLECESIAYLLAINEDHLEEMPRTAASLIADKLKDAREAFDRLTADIHAPLTDSKLQSQVETVIDLFKDHRKAWRGVRSIDDHPIPVGLYAELQRLEKMLRS